MKLFIVVDFSKPSNKFFEITFGVRLYFLQVKEDKIFSTQQ